MKEKKYRKPLKVRRTRSDVFWDQVIAIFLVAVALLTLLPFLYVLAGSFSTEQELTERAFFIIPHTISFNAYKYITQTGEIFRGLKNSLFLTVFGTVCSLFFTSTFLSAFLSPFLPASLSLPSFFFFVSVSLSSFLSLSLPFFLFLFLFLSFLPSS